MRERMEFNAQMERLALHTSFTGTGGDRGLNTGRIVDVLEGVHGSSLPVASIFLSDIQSKDTDMRNLLKLLEIQKFEEGAV